MTSKKKASQNGEADLENRKKRKALLKRCGLLALAFLLVFSLTSQGRAFWRELFQVSGFGGTAQAPLAIHVLEVGKADAILIECEGETALLDAGTAVSGEVIVDYMARHRIASLKYAIASHPDNDHIGGMSQVLSEVEAECFLRAPYFSKKYEEVQAILLDQGIPEKILSAGDTINLGSATLQVLGPIKKYEDTNNSSLVIRLEYQGFTALFCGDIEEEAERDLAETYGAEISSKLLKVPHHGSKTSCTDQFLELVEPEYAIVSVGRDQNNLPAESVLKRLSGICDEIYQTDTDGTVIFTFQENRVQVFRNQ